MTTVFSLTVNDNPVEVKSTEVKRLLSVITTIDNPLADSIQFALNQKALNPATGEVAPLRDFYPASFSAKNADDIFQVTLTQGESVIVAEATRQVISNRLNIASNLADYKVEIQKTQPVTGEGKTPKAQVKAAADEI